MSWRFRKTFKVLPGVKLNLTRHGLSATVGVAPLSLNIGPKGVYSNVSIPGTGLWDREPLVSQPPGVQSPATRGAGAPAPLPPASSIPSIHIAAQTTEIRSASTELLGSESMAQLRTLLKEAYDEREVLAKEISAATNEADFAVGRYQSWDRGFLMKRMCKRAFAVRKEASETAVAKLEELRDQLRLTTLATEIGIDREQAESYYRMRDDFAALSECKKIWDTLERHAINRVAERSAANEVITREPVSFSLNSCDLLQWEQKVPHLPNRTGGDLYIYPGFILYRAAKQAFALIDSREVNLRFRPQRFIEREAIPADSEVVEKAWAKSNKDGSADRRFRDNYQIPVVLYASLTFTSPSGLHEEFQLSNPALGERFAKAWEAFQSSLGSAAHRRAKTIAQEAQPPEHLDAATIFAKESAKARALAVEHDDDYWEFLLAEELLRARLTEVQREGDELDKTIARSPKRPFQSREYVDWLGDKLQELTDTVLRMTNCLEQELPVAWGAPGVEGDAIRIFQVVNEIAHCCRALLGWELEICLADPPRQLSRLGNTLRGSTAGILQQINRVPDQLSRGIEGLRTGASELKISLNIATPPQIARFTAEMDIANKHPEWLDE